MAGKPIAQWLADLDSEDDAIAQRASNNLWDLEPTDADAVPLLLDLLGPEPSPHAYHAIRALSRIGPAAAPAAPLLRALLKDPASRPHWRFCADTLGYIGPAAREALPELEPLLRSDDPWERALAAGALLKLRPDDPGPLEELDRAKREPNIALQCWAIMLLLQVVESCPEALGASLRWLDQEYDPHIEDLRDMLPRVTERAQPLLIAALGSPDPLIRGNAATVLSRQTADRAQAVAALAQTVLSDPDERARWRAACALHVQREIGSDLRPILPALRQAAAREGDYAGDTVRELLNAAEGA